MAQRLPGPTVSVLVARLKFPALAAALADHGGRAFLAVPEPFGHWRVSLKDEPGAADLLTRHAKRGETLFRNA